MKNMTISIALLFMTYSNVYAGLSTEEAKAKQVVSEYFSALNKSDVEKIISLYHKNSVFLPNNSPASRGVENIKRTYQTVLSAIKLDTTHKYFHVSVTGDLAVVESKAAGNLTILKNKQELPANDNELFVLRKINGIWKIDRYMFNSSEPH